MALNLLNAPNSPKNKLPPKRVIHRKPACENWPQRSHILFSQWAFPIPLFFLFFPLVCACVRANTISDTNHVHDAPLFFFQMTQNARLMNSHATLRATYRIASPLTGFVMEMQTVKINPTRCHVVRDFVDLFCMIARVYIM